MYDAHPHFLKKSVCYISDFVTVIKIWINGENCDLSSEINIFKTKTAINKTFSKQNTDH